MEGNNPNTPFYNHDNNSTSSTLQYIPGTNISSQVSSVGFNNLKKLNTNTSQASTASNATNKSNPLTRLFTKNKSPSNINQQSIQFEDTADVVNNSDEDNSTTTTSDPKKASSNGLFRLSKKNKLKFPNKNNSSKPDLAIQTGGHHALKVPKKILSSSLLEDSSITTSHGLKLPKKILNNDDSLSNSGRRRSSVSSPVSTFHNLFHRSYNSQPAKDQQLNYLKDDISHQQTINNNPNRTAMSLSSNNSNSYVTDINFALVYNFTNPDHSIEEFESSGEHTSFLDIHKKLMIPTDQYLQNKLHKHLTPEIGLGIVDSDSDNEYVNRYLVDFGKRNVNFFNNLLQIMKPLFQPSQQKKLNTGMVHPYLGITIEDIANYIRDNYLNDSLGETTSDQHLQEKSPTSKFSKSKARAKFYNTSSTSTLSLADNGNEKLDDSKVREISQDLLTFFIKCMITFKKDFTSYSKTMDKPYQKTDDNQLHFMTEWDKMSYQWQYFNEKIRYNVVGIFHPLQKLLHDISIQRFNIDPNNQFDIDIENILLLAFRDVIVVSFLAQRKQEYQRLYHTNQRLVSDPQSVSPSPVTTYTFQLDSGNENGDGMMLQEEQALKSEPKLLKILLNCFGVIVAHTHNESGNSDGEQHIRNNLFSDSFTWLSRLNK